MTADGNWSVVVATPLGERRGTLSVKTEGTTLKGSQMADDGKSADIFDGTIKTYDDFLVARRPLMAGKIKTWFESL